MKKILVVVDMQNDFVDGSLGTPEAQAIVESCVKKTQSFSGEVVFTFDTHTSEYFSTQEGRKLPVEHCIEGTPGWELVAPLAQVQKERGAKVFKKGTFGSLELAAWLCEVAQEEGIESIELVGLCTDICVVSNALLIKAHLPEVPLVVDSSCCAGVTPQAHKAALATMQSCQIEVL